MSREATTPGAAADASPRVVRDDGAGAYEVWLGDRRAGVAAFTRRGPSEIAFTHTEIGKEFGGRGLGSVLAGEALRDAVDRGLTIVPFCPFIASYLRKHPIEGASVRWPETAGASEDTGPVGPGEPQDGEAAPDGRRQR